MEWRIVITPRAERELKRLPARDQGRIRIALGGLITLPRREDIQKLQGSEEEWRLRVGDYRVRFVSDSRNRIIVVLHVLPRGRAYR